MSAPELGALRPEDYLPLVELFSKLGARYTCDAGDPATRAVFESYLSDERKTAVAARVDGALSGVLLFEVTPGLSASGRVARADGMVVSPAHRGRGIGHALLREAFRVAAARGAAHFLIKASDPGVIAMYRRMPDLLEEGVYFYHDPVPPLARKEATHAPG
jgi:ribosomal protein S18 acetylase RimI-like enzyme